MSEDNKRYGVWSLAPGVQLNGETVDSLLIDDKPIESVVFSNAVDPKNVVILNADGTEYNPGPVLSTEFFRQFKPGTPQEPLNLKRIIACYNALASIPDDKLGDIKVLLERIRRTERKPLPLMAHLLYISVRPHVSHEIEKQAVRLPRPLSTSHGMLKDSTNVIGKLVLSG